MPPLVISTRYWTELRAHRTRTAVCGAASGSGRPDRSIGRVEARGTATPGVTANGDGFWKDSEEIPKTGLALGAIVTDGPWEIEGGGDREVIEPHVLAPALIDYRLCVLCEPSEERQAEDRLGNENLYDSAVRASPALCRCHGFQVTFFSGHATAVTRQ
jgi:hypothetical protein